MQELLWQKQAACGCDKIRPEIANPRRERSPQLDLNQAWSQRHALIFFPKHACTTTTAPNRWTSGKRGDSSSCIRTKSSRWAKWQRAVNISPNHLSEKFKAITGVNFVDYVNRLRIAKARHLLTKRGSSDKRDRLCRRLPIVVAVQSRLQKACREVSYRISHSARAKEESPLTASFTESGPLNFDRKNA